MNKNYTVKVDDTIFSEASLERIRQIVREEIAANEERRHQEVTEFLAATEGLVRGTSGSQE